MRLNRDNWLMLVIGVVVVVVIEVIAYRAYKRYRARKEARFTKESLGEVFGDMEATRAYLLRAKEFLKQCSKQAKEEGDEAVACLVDSLLAGERAQLEGLEELRQKLDAKAVEFQKKEYDFPTLADALESYAAEAAAWAYDTVPGMVQRARKEGYRDVAKQLRIIGWCRSATTTAGGCAPRAAPCTSAAGRRSAPSATNRISKWSE